MAEITLYGKTIDGFIGYENATYATCHDNATGTVNTDWNDMYVGQKADASHVHSIYRGAFFFDTSCLGADATISGAVLSFKIYYMWTTGAYTLTVVNSTNVSGSGLATGDYGDIKNNTTSYGTIATGSISWENYNNINLNASGYGSINKSGTTVFCLRTDEDINSTDIPAETSNFIQIYSANKGSGYEPKLVITYTAATYTPKANVGIGPSYLF